MIVDELYCIYCSKKYDQSINSDGGLKNCSKCGKKPIDEATMLTALNLLDVTLNICKKCNSASPSPNKYCFRCGENFI
jgi:ribosomal protein L40E